MISPVNIQLFLEQEKINVTKFYQLSNHRGKILIIQISYLTTTLHSPFLH